MEPEEQYFPGDSSTLKSITVMMPDAGAFLTRSTFQIDNNGVHVLWAEDDTLGILPAKGDQVYFPMTNGAGSNSANFDGGNWGLKDAATYSAYFPFSRKYYSAPHNAIRLEYEGQKQNGNDNAEHMGAFDYLASGSAAPVDNYLSLNLVRLGSIACFKVTVPDPGTYTEAVISSDADFVVSADLDITGSSPVVTPVETSNKLVLKLNNVTTATANQVVTMYMMVSPINLTGHEVRISLHGDGVACYATLPAKNMVAGKPYMFQAGSALSAIGFADPLVKSICLANWDTDGNGDLSYDEAAAVVSIGTCFKGKNITSFDEFANFTSVTSLSPQAFSGCSKLTSVVLPAGITSLGSSAFKGCTKLSSIVLPSTVEELGEYAFDGCSAITSLSLPASLTTIGDYALRGLSKVTGVSIPLGVTVGAGLLAGWTSLSSFAVPADWTVLPDNTFNGCANLQSIVVPEGITYIGESCFKGCSSLASVSLPSSLKTLKSYAFENCISLGSVTIPSGVETHGPYALFSGCSSLTSVNMPSSFTEWGDAYFNGCTSLQSITVPEGVVALGCRCFGGCTSLVDVSLPGSLILINENCFSDCSALQSIVIPEKINEIRQGTFANCSSLSNVVLPNGLKAIGSKTDTNGPFKYCSSLKSITIPSGVAYIGSYSFFYAGLESITLPDSVVSVGDAAFERCGSLESIILSRGLTCLNQGIFYGTRVKQLTIPSSVKSIMQIWLWNGVESITLQGATPPVLVSDSVIPDNGCPIYVPGEAVNTYKTAPIWSNYASRIAAASDGDANNPDPGNWD